MLESALSYLGVEVDDALEIAAHSEIRGSSDGSKRMVSVRPGLIAISGKKLPL